MDNSLHWFAVYTKPRNEKKLTLLLQNKGIDVFLPLRKTLKEWSDRKKMVEEPLISSYVFVNVDQRDYYEVLNTDGAVKYIWFSGKPAIIPASQIDVLKKIISSGAEVECVAGNFQTGSIVEINRGPLTGLKGELIAIAGKKKLLIRIQNLEKNLVVSVSPGMVM
ncbi:MAG: UpxY family transcription antiterminator [Syntrophothermus sp.]